MLLLALLTIAGSVAAAPSGSKTQKEFHVNIVEQGTHFTQTVDVDVDNNVERIVIPSHNDVSGATFIYDFNMNVSVRLTNGRCFVTDLSRALELGYAVPPGEMYRALEKAQEAAPSGEVETVVNKWRIGEKLSSLEGLSPAMEELCEGSPTYALHPLRDEVSVGDEGHRGYHSRSRRQVDNNPETTVRCHRDAWGMRCKLLLSNCDYIFYANCDAEEYRRTTTRRAHCTDDNTIHVYDQVVCCKDCCTDASRADSTFFPYCDGPALETFTCN